VNVGGTGKLAMRDLVALCEEIGFSDVKTYIQSGNVVFNSRAGAASVKSRLEKGLADSGHATRVIVRDGAELARVERNNPYRDAAPNQVLVLFLDEPAKKSAAKDLVIPGREEVTIKGREVYIHFPDGMGRSKLKTPFVDAGTGRNLNTVRKLISMSE